MSVSVADVFNNKIIPMCLPGEFKKFIGNLPANKQYAMLVYGAPFSGKSVWCLKLARILCDHGNVIYANYEEDVAGGTLQHKIKLAKIRRDEKKIKFLEADDIDDLKKKLSHGNYKLCIIDSVSDVAMCERDLADIFDLRKQYRNINFIFVLHSDKDGKKFLGPNKLEHKVDITLYVKHGIVDCTKKNRYKSGTFHNRFMYYDLFKEKALDNKPEVPNGKEKKIKF